MLKMNKTDNFITKAREIHGDKYDYSKVIYKNIDTKVEIICPKHGIFWQSPYNHLKGHGCTKCSYDKMSKDKNMGKDTFIQKAKEIHGDKYDYSKVEYINNRMKVCIICPIHGEFWQSPYCHLNGSDCYECGKKKISNKLKGNNEIFVNKAISKHGNKYDYSKVNYINSDEKVCIICPEHGEFWQAPHKHIYGNGCPICGKTVKSNTDEFIEKARKVHGDKYDYSKVEYVNNSTKVCIICPEHGEFWQTPGHHLNKRGCPKCKKSIMENDVEKILINKKIKYEHEYTFDWLKYKNNLRLDFYLPDYNIAIECQGEQHFRVPNFGNTYEHSVMIFEQTQIRDKIKKDLCQQHNIPIYYINYNESVEEKMKQLLERL